jgi:MFS family permease
VFARFSDGFLALRLMELGAPTWLCMATIGIFNTISTLCCYPIGRLSDKVNRSKLLYFSYVTLLLCNLCFIYATDVWLGLLGVIMWGAQRGTSQILFTAIVADEAPKQIMGTALGLFYIVIGLMSLLAGVACGYFADGSLTSSFIFGAVVSTLATLSLAIRNRFFNTKPTTDSSLATSS